MGDLWGYKDDPEEWNRPWFSWGLFFRTVAIVIGYLLLCFLMCVFIKLIE